MHMSGALCLALAEAPSLEEDLDKAGKSSSEGSCCRKGQALEIKDLAPGPKLSFLLPLWP